LLVFVTEVTVTVTVQITPDGVDVIEKSDTAEDVVFDVVK